MLQAQVGARLFGGFSLGSASPVGQSSRSEKTVTVSRMQREVTDSLKAKMPGVWKMEYHPFPESELGGLRALNVDLAWPSKKICVEVQGPSHYLVGAEGGGRNVVNGATKFKRRVLEKMGWRVGEVEWWRWQEEGAGCLKDILKGCLSG